MLKGDITAILLSNRPEWLDDSIELWDVIFNAISFQSQHNFSKARCESDPKNPKNGLQNWNLKRNWNYNNNQLLFWFSNHLRYDINYSIRKNVFRFKTFFTPQAHMLTSRVDVKCQTTKHKDHANSLNHHLIQLKVHIRCNERLMKSNVYLKSRLLWGAKFG